MKRTILLSMAVCTGAASLRGEGVEEVGEQIEHFPREDYNGMIDRRTLKKEVAEPTEEVFDAWPDRDVVGMVVEDEDEIYVEEYVDGDEEEDYGEDKTAEAYTGDSDNQIILGEESVETGDDTPTSKEYVRDAHNAMLVDTDLVGEAVDQYDRRESTCGEGKSEFKVTFATDKYAYENSWSLAKVNGDTIADGPPDGTNYVDESTYAGRWCLGPGAYKFQMIDEGLDGICSSNSLFGCGELRLFLNGKDAGKIVDDVSNWRVKDLMFNVAATSGRIDGVLDNVSRPQWCKKVRSVMQVPKGTCTLPNGRRGHRVRVTTKVDKFGKETSWQIMEKDGNVVRMKMGPIIPANEHKSVEDCLPAGEYNLKVQDIDGVCCRHGQGFFKLLVNGEELLKGGSFHNSIDHDFQLGFDWISSMNERDCEWWWAHDRRRRDWHTRCYDGFYCNKEYRHLKWSPALKEDAQDYANRLLDTCDTTGIKHDLTDQGENLAKNRGSGLWGEQYPADKITKRFVDNEEFWGWNANAHLTQAMWYSSRYIGCAESVKSMGGAKMCRMQVCRYTKAGNCVMGKYSSEVGNNWMIPMMMEDSPCGPMCASRDGCYH